MWALCYFCLSVVLLLQWMYIARLKRQLDGITSVAAAFLEAGSDG